MRGEKLDAAKQSYIDIFRRLQKDDLLTVITFDNDVEVISNPQTPSMEVEERLDSILRV